ncbi:MAG: DsbA family oxidoreductase [Dechloromonas sp.]|nr:DsbA family oxidoreductase [Dechloromonas sp.]
MPTTSPTTLQLDIVSDIVCPWCFIGLRRLDVALAQLKATHPALQIVTRWQPFFLNPQTPPSGEPYLPFLIEKFGSEAAVAALFQRVRDAGAAYGLDYQFEKIALRANTLQAHRLIYWAQQRGDARPLVERLFVGQFQRGEHIGDPAVLLEIAVACGYPSAEVADYLASERDYEQIRHMEEHYRASGVRAVPTFIVDQRLMIPGAEDPTVLVAAIEQALASRDDAKTPH